MLRALEITETFKQKKSGLMREGFDPALVSDALYFADPERRSYVRLGAELHRSIGGGELRI